MTVSPCSRAASSWCQANAYSSFLLQITSGLNAIAHAVEALWAPEANPIISNLAVQGIEAIGKSLPLIKKDANDRDGRSNALFGAWACGTCLGAVGMSLHHKMVSMASSLTVPITVSNATLLPSATP